MNSNAKHDLTLYIEPHVKKGDLIDSGSISRGNLLNMSPDIMQKIITLAQSTATSFYNSIKLMSADHNSPTNAKIEFGLNLNIKGEAFIASVSSHSSIKITMEWSLMEK